MTANTNDAALCAELRSGAPANYRTADERMARAAARIEELVSERDAAVREREALREFAQDFADEECSYGDNCPSTARHYRCYQCKARAAIASGPIGSGG